MLSRQQLEALFVYEGASTRSINFGVRKEISESGPIQSREVATRKSLEQDVLQNIAGLEGSPSFEVIKSLVKTLSDTRVLPQLSGVGLEMGSGLGLLSAAVIENDDRGSIIGILAVEAGAPFVESGIRLAAETTLGNLAHKIIPCYGSFDEVQVESNSIDFIIQIEALHHADTLSPPLIEANRILKTNGVFISIDRSWPNSVKNEVLTELLDHQYSKEWLDAKGFPSKEPFSRRDNGEHEYRDSDWELSFRETGFECIQIRHLHPQFKIWHLKKRIVGMFGLNGIAKIKIPSRHGIFRGLLFEALHLKSLGLGAVIKTAHPRPLTVSVWRKSGNAK
jgi:SAM-dependent methyltransferase